MRVPAATLRRHEFTDNERQCRGNESGCSGNLRALRCNDITEEESCYSTGDRRKNDVTDQTPGITGSKPSLRWDATARP